MKPPPVLPTIAVICATACGSDLPLTTMAVREDSAGVEVVKNAVVAQELAVRLDTLRVMGGDASGPTSFYRVRRPLIDVDGADRIYVLDPSQHRVVALSEDGVALQTWGREGEGPGELVAPLSVTVSDIGDVVVHDPAKGVFVRYNRDGSYRDQIPAPAVLTTSLRQVEQIDAALVMWARASLDGDRVDRLLWVTPGDATALIGGKPSYRSTAHHARCGVTFGVGVPLAPRLFWSQAGNRVATVTSPDFRIDVFDEGRHVRQVWMGEASPELSRAEAISILTADSVIGPCNSSPDEFVDLHGYFPRLQYVRDMSIDPDGRLWVTWREPGGEDRMVLFDETGQAVGLLPPGFPMPLSFLADGRMLLRVVDGLGVERIGIGRIAPG